MMKTLLSHTRALLTCGLLAILLCQCDTRPSIFARDNLVAWCIVPYDAKERGPVERAQMLRELGITRLAYDWREKHIPTFDDEWKALREHNIKLQAFWVATGRDPANDKNVQAVFDFLERNKVRTQLWLFVMEWPGFDSLRQEEKVRAMAEPIGYVADRASALGCTVALYNHRRWFGEPENQLAILEYLDRPGIGIVYNFHHAVEHHERFAEFLPKIKPYLMTVNIAGIRGEDRKGFYDVGDGDVEGGMIRILLNNGYDGPVGIINHDENRDAREGLLKQMRGLDHVLRELEEHRR